MKKFPLFLFLLLWRFIMADDPTPAPTPAPAPAPAPADPFARFPAETRDAIVKAEADLDASDAADSEEADRRAELLTATHDHDAALEREADAHQAAAKSGAAAIALLTRDLRQALSPPTS